MGPSPPPAIRCPRAARRRPVLDELGHPYRDVTPRPENCRSAGGEVGRRHHGDGEDAAAVGRVAADRLGLRREDVGDLPGGDGAHGDGVGAGARCADPVTTPPTSQGAPRRRASTGRWARRSRSCGRSSVHMASTRHGTRRTPGYPRRCPGPPPRGCGRLEPIRGRERHRGRVDAGIGKDHGECAGLVRETRQPLDPRAVETDVEAVGSLGGSLSIELGRAVQLEAFQPFEEARRLRLDDLEVVAFAAPLAESLISRVGVSSPQPQRVGIPHLPGALTSPLDDRELVATVE